MRHHGDQPQHCVRVVSVQGQGLTVAGLGTVQLVLLSLHTGEGNVAIGLTRLAGNGLLQQAASFGQIIASAGFFGLVEQAPVTVTVQRRLPARVAAAADGPAQQFIGIVETPLALAHHAKAAEGIAVAGLFLEPRHKRLLGNLQLLVLQGLEAPRDLGVLLRRHTRSAAAVHLRANGRVIRVGLEISLEQRLVHGSWRADPDQPFAPAFSGLAAQLRHRRQLRQAAQAFGTGGFVAYQQLGQRQAYPGVVRRLLLQTLQALTRLAPAAGRIAQGVVVLQRQITLGRLAGEDLAVDRHRLGKFAVGHQQARRVQLLGVVARLHGNGLLQQQGRAFARVGTTQLPQVIAGTVKALALELKHAKAIECIGLFGVDQQQLFPDLGGPRLVILGLPVLTLLQQRLARVVKGGKAGAVYQACEDPEREGVAAS